MGDHKDTEIQNKKTFKVNEIADKAEVLNEKAYFKVADRNVTSRKTNSLFLLLRMEMILKLYLICFLFRFVICLKEQRFAIEPQDQSAVVGSRVTLPCRVVNKAGQLQWTKDDFGLGTHRHLVGYERYKMIGSDEEGDYSLDIMDVTLDDDALYQCQVSTGSRGEAAIRSRYARLIVLVPPEPPRILQGSVLQAIEDREVSLVCVSVGGKPAAEITWVDNDGGVLTQGVNYTVETMSDARRFTAKSVLHFRPRRHHHNQTFTCQAQNTADRAYRAVTIKLQVQYSPRVRVFLKSGIVKGRIQEGDTLIIGCQAHGNPNSLIFKWYVNNKQVVSDISNELVITNISRNLNEATIKCEVHNAVGKSSDTKTIEVTYGPSFKLRPYNVEGESGSSVTMHCVVDGHPSPKMIWLRSENDRVIKIGKSENLTITVSQYTAGQYWCRASVDGYQDIEAAGMVYVKGPPKILSNQTQYGLEGDSVRLECISFSVPKPDYVLWSFGGNEINSYQNHEYVFLEESLADGMTKSTLIIKESEKRHFGNYNCSVTNLYGTDSLEIQLIPDKSYPLIMIISGSSSAAVLILMGMLIIMLCHKKNKKTDLVKKPDLTHVGKTCVEQFKDCDRSSNISDLKLELRQIEGSLEIDNHNISETEIHSTLHLTSNLGLPLAGPVSLPEAYDNELMKQYQRYSADFNTPLSDLNHKTNTKANGYVPYVDYARDYAPPGDSLTGSLARHTDTLQCNSLHRHTSCGRLGGLAGPDLIPLSTNGVGLVNGADVRFAATYGNPYLRGSGPISYTPHMNTANPGTTPAPPPYYSIRNSNIHPPALSGVPAGSSPSSSSSSRPVTSPMASLSSSASGAQPQVPKPSQLNSSALYILPPSGQGNVTQITAKGNPQSTSGTHV